MTQNSTITRLPESTDQVLCVALTGLIRREDHEKYLNKPVQAMIGRYGQCSLLFHYDDEFKGWEPDAAAANMNAILTSGAYARKLAYIDPPEKKILQLKLAEPLIAGEIRYFSREQLPEALAWVKASTPA